MPESLNRLQGHVHITIVKWTVCIITLCECVCIGLLLNFAALFEIFLRIVFARLARCLCAQWDVPFWKSLLDCLKLPTESLLFSIVLLRCSSSWPESRSYYSSAWCRGMRAREAYCICIIRPMFNNVRIKAINEALTRVELKGMSYELDSPHAKNENNPIFFVK